MKPIHLDNTYAALGDAFYVKTCPQPVARPALVKFNEELAGSLGLKLSGSDDYAAVFSGNVVPDGAEPLAMTYAGHQFGNFVPQLGDGRALLLGEVTSPGGGRFDVHLKGSGRTVFSRNGDGRAALGPVLREYLVSEAMHCMGVPTTRALAAVTTGEEVARERLLPGGIITRVAKSFVRVGTFEYFAARGDNESIRTLANYVIERCYPDVGDSDRPYAAMLQAVVDRQADLIAQWMQLGFIHGVMNTDNMSIAGETIDYGPCAFMDHYDHNRVYSSIDRGGRYSYSNQPSIGLWNLTRLAETLLPLLDENTGSAVEIAKSVLNSYVERYQQTWLAGMQAKCGLSKVSEETGASDRALIESLLDTMAANNADFTLTFYYLSQLSLQVSGHDKELRGLFDNPASLDGWLARWRERLSSESDSDVERQQKMQAINPVYIPRNHQVEAAIRAAEDRNDFSVFHDLHAVLQKPYVKQEGKHAYMLPPEPHEVVEQTFCGT